MMTTSAATPGSASARLTLGSASASSIDNRVGFPSINVPTYNNQSGSSNIVPFTLSGSSPSSRDRRHHQKLEDSQISLNSTSSALLYSIVNTPANQKLSLSSADSSSSAPNSPPPNYDEVFDPNSTLQFPQIHFNGGNTKTYFSDYFSLSLKNVSIKFRHAKWSSI